MQLRSQVFGLNQDVEDLMEIVEIQKSRRTVSDIETNNTNYNSSQAGNILKILYLINYTYQTHLACEQQKRDPQIPSDIYLFVITYLQ